LAGRFSQIGLGGDSSQPSGECTNAEEGGYVLSKMIPLGDGASGIVYGASKGKSRKKTYVVKRSKNKKGRTDILVEVERYEILGELGLSGISEMVEVFDDGTNVDLVLKKCNGNPLGNIKGMIKRNHAKQFSMIQAKQALTQIATVLKNIHDNGIAHGDLHRHYDNVMIKTNKKRNTADAMIIDWGNMVTKEKSLFGKYRQLDGRGFAKTVKHVLECTKVNDDAEKLEKAELCAKAKEACSGTVSDKGINLINEWLE